MATLSHRGFRQLLSDFGGWDFTVTEMTSAEALLNGTPFAKSYTDLGPDPARVIVQLTAYDPESFAAGAERFLPGRPGGIDLNMGCSAPKVRKRGGGAGWLVRPREAVAAAARVLQARDAWEQSAGLPGPAISVKLRLPKDGALPPLIELLEALAETGVEWVTLHGRRVGQPYARPASWDALATVAESSPLPLCANGDIRSPEDMFLLLERRSFAGIMPARGVAQKPWLPLLISRSLHRAGAVENTKARSAGGDAPGARLTAPPRTYAETAERYHRYLEEHLPPEFWKTRARRFYAYFAANFQFGHELAAGSQSMSSYKEIKTHALKRIERWDKPLPIPE